VPLRSETAHAARGQSRDRRRRGSQIDASDDSAGSLAGKQPRSDQLDPEALKRLARSILRVFPAATELAADPELKLLGSRAYLSW
jgi:hypothetical protein